MLRLSPFVLAVPLLACGCCGNSKDSSERVLSDFCDGVDLARIEYGGYFGAAKNEARLAAESDERRAELCVTLGKSLYETNAYLSGYNKHYRFASSATGDAVVHVQSSSLLGNIVEAQVYCRNGDFQAVNRILSTIESEIESDFEQQPAICRKRGWQSVSIRTAPHSD
jgi:hypothetical protein